MIHWRDEGGRIHSGSLFAAFAALARGEAWSFPALRPHQREPWHAFTVQVAALALIRAGRDTLPVDEAAWRDLLIGLTPDYPDGEAWELVVDDWSKPALLQPPLVSPADRAAYNVLPTPDALDMLVTAKNHDVKAERMADASAEEWLFALVTLQTTEGFLGAGNYGIARMNGGFASRMMLGIRPGAGGAAGGFARDVRRLVADARSNPARRSGTALLWTVPWDGTLSLALPDLDTLFVEICRRIRLRRTADRIDAAAAGSKVARVAGVEHKGRTEDPWAPLKADQSSSHTPTGAGFGYRQVAHLLDKAKITRPPLAEPDATDAAEGLSIVAAALVRGQGKTEGLHRRAIRMSRMEQVSAFEQAPLDRIGDIAAKRAEQASEAGNKLRLALIALIQGGPDEPRWADDAAKRKAEPWIARYDRIVDNEFFDAPFWDEAADPGTAPIPANHRLPWRTRLSEIADEVFEAAADAAPRTELRRVRARARARAMLDGQMRKWKEEVLHGE